MMSAQDDRGEGSAGNLGADVGFGFDFIRGEVEARGTVDAVGVEQRHGGHLEVLAHSNEFLGQGRAFEKTEGRARVKFDVHQCQLPVPRKVATDFHG